MNRTIILLVVSLVFATVFFACKSDEQSAEPGEGKINGTVVDVATNGPLAGVSVTASPSPTGQATKVTAADGVFDFTYSTDSTESITLRFQKSGFRDTTIVVQVSSASVTTVTMVMRSSTPISGGTTSGLASTIYLVNAAPPDISVYGVGGNETSYLTWEVRDSVGLPIDAAHAVTLSFSFTGGLNGGEFIYPVSVLTNAEGQATTSLSSGIVSGAVQVVATAHVGSRTIISEPVQIVIHSGLPHISHFTLGAVQYNFPALHVLGKRDNISVLVGDIYSNPVATNTAVYFASRAGVILSSAFTSSSGEGSVDLISGNPYPLGTNALTPYGEGYHYVIASTVGRGGTIVRDSILLLWTGYTVIDSISPGTFNIPNGGIQRIDFKVSDQYGHPLSAPSSITATTTGSQAIVAFGFNGTFTISRDVILPVGYNTHFTCFVSDNLPDTTYTSSATLSISVSSAGNGNATETIGGTIH